MNTKPDPAWFDLQGAQSYSALSRSSLYNRLKSGELEGRKLGKRLVISRASIDRMMSNLPKFGQAA